MRTGTRSQRRCPLASTVEIAARTEADLPLLFGLAKVAFVDLPGWSDERVLEVLRRDLTFVAREEGQPAGYVALRRKQGGSILIEQLFVAPGHERRGIGHRLLAYAEGYAIAERAHSLQIVVEEGNHKARSFYRRSGFVPVEPELFELSFLALTEEGARVRLAISTLRAVHSSPVCRRCPSSQASRTLDALLDLRAA